MLIMKRKIFLGISIAMLLLAAGFMVYAFNNPQASFPWSNTITYMIYAVYAVMMAGCFALSRIIRK